jgi:nitrogen fixation uncharacterized protein
MSDSSVAKFIAYLKDNPDVRKQLQQLERSLGYAIRQEDESIAAIAVEAGFDVSKWNSRAAVAEPTRPAPQVQAAVCCGILTSDITLLV